MGKLGEKCIRPNEAWEGRRDIRNPTLNLPSAVVIACGQKPMEIVGPFPELVPDFLALHEGYWDKGS